MRLKIVNFTVIVCVGALITIFLTTQWYKTQDCEQEVVGLVDSSHWQLSESTPDVRIIWQLTEHKPPATVFIGQPNSGLVASDTQVVYRREAAYTLCDKNSDIIAFDLLTGNEAWRLPRAPSHFGYSRFGYSSYADVFRSIKAVSDGYVFISGDRWVFKFTNDRQLTWWNDSFPSRSLQSIYVGDEALYLPSYSKIYKIAQESGGLIETITLENVVGFFDEVALIGDLTLGKVKAIDWRTSEEKFSIQLSDSTVLVNAIQNQRPFTDRSENILFVYNSSFNPTHIDAYSLITGKLLWSLDKSLYGFPLLLSNRLVVFSSDGLEIRDIEDGELLKQIPLHRVQDGQTEPNVFTSVWLAGYNNIVVINFRDTWELVALQLQDSDSD